MQKFKKILLLLKALAFLLCSVLFLLLMKDVWIKFQLKTTTTGIRFESLIYDFSGFLEKIIIVWSKPTIGNVNPFRKGIKNGQGGG